MTLSLPSIIHLAVIGAVIGMFGGVWAVLNRPAFESDSAAPASSVVLQTVSTAGGVSPHDSQPVWREVIRAQLAARRFAEVDRLVRSMRHAVDQGDALAYVIGVLVPDAAEYNLDQSEAKLFEAGELDPEPPPEAGAFTEVRGALIQLSESIEDSGIRARSLARIAIAEVFTRQAPESTNATFVAMNAAYEKHRAIRPSLWDRLLRGWEVVAKLGMVGSLGALFTGLLVNAVWYYVERLAGTIWGEKGVAFVRNVHSSGQDPSDSKVSTAKL